MKASDITYYLCGGTGINIGLALLANSRTPQNKEATFVGLDTSDANSSSEKFEIERLKIPGADADDNSKKIRGSGKKRDEHYEISIPFIAQVMSRRKPGSYAVVVTSDAGGTGPTFATQVLRHLIKQNIPTILVVVSDHTSTIEMANSTGVLRGFANQTSPDLLNAPITFIQAKNTPEETRGEVNSRLVERLDLLSLFLTETNGEMDYADFRNFVFYNRVSKIPPAFSEIRFYDQDSYKQHSGKVPVAVASLFASSDDVIPVFEGTTYRTTGVFAEGTPKPKGMTQLHMVLDHGEALAALEKQITKLEDHRAEQSAVFVKQKDLGGSSNADGLCFD